MWNLFFRKMEFFFELHITLETIRVGSQQLVLPSTSVHGQLKQSLINQKCSCNQQFKFHGIYNLQQRTYSPNTKNSSCIFVFYPVPGTQLCGNCTLSNSQKVCGICFRKLISTNLLCGNLNTSYYLKEHSLKRKNGNSASVIQSTFLPFCFHTLCTSLYFLCTDADFLSLLPIDNRNNKLFTGGFRI